jgi:hypothetical protein
VKSEEDNKNNPNDTTLIAATQFNDAIKSFYFDLKNSSQDKVDLCMNYYLDRMTKVKVKNNGTRASALIPVTLNFTTDGISGMYMGNSFTVPDEILPYSYSRILLVGDPNGNNAPTLKNLGFIVTGLEHSLENNRWKTSVKANMYYLKMQSDYVDIETRDLAKDSGNVENIGDIDTGGAGGVGEFEGIIPETTNVPNANALREKIKEISKKYGGRLTVDDNDLSSWADITENLLNASSKLFETILGDSKYSDLTINIGNANDRWHAQKKRESNLAGIRYAAPHCLGRGMDFTVNTAGSTDKYGLNWKKEAGEYVLDKNQKKFGDPSDPRYKTHQDLTSAMNKIISDQNLPVYGKSVLDEYMLSTKYATGPHYHLTVT